MTSNTRERYSLQKDLLLLDGRDQMPVTFERDSGGKVPELSFTNGEHKSLASGA
ncbi:MAG: hypothetical protein V4594_20350 [Bacteroidota bacterium]